MLDQDVCISPKSNRNCMVSLPGVLRVGKTSHHLIYHDIFDICDIFDSFDIFEQIKTRNQFESKVEVVWVLHHNLYILRGCMLELVICNMTL